MNLNRFAKDLLAGRWVEIGRTGSFRASTGPVTFTRQHFEEAALDYDENFRPAPLVIGHPTMLGTEGERLAHGLVSALRVVGDTLQAKIVNLSDEVKSKLASGQLIGRSMEFWTKRHDTGRAYLDAIALLGGSQPGIPAMLSDDGASASVIFDDTKPNSDTEIKQPPNHEGAANMADQDVGKLQEQLAALQAQVAELSKRPNISAEEFAALSTQVADLKKVSDENKNLKTQMEALREQNADAAILAACKGIPKALASDEKKALMKQLFLSGDTKSFNALVAELDAARTKFSYLTEELVGEGEGAVVNNYKPNKDADPDSAKIASKAAQLRAADKNLSIEASIKQARKELANG